MTTESQRNGSGLTHITEPPGVAPGTGYTQVVSATGRLVAVSGQVAFDEQRRLVGAGDPEAQARQIFENLRRCLAAAGADFSHVVKLTYFLTDIGHLDAVRKARNEALGELPPPASSAMQVAALFLPEVLIEIEAFAVVPE
ncbi:MULTISPECIES: RidA family protein [unclassified Streptomyces]|uniref:RidA family protein n=1 Tax=unclassified Streptomyces TaxID=2593676 RepID=UPI0005F8EC65|nr:MULTISPECIES: RidA family protein [unclassified Streptomyces]KJY29977.1 endoribonuclease L-PSP [Streptomyces sp. NRRL S-495]KOV13818.1 endoribonuclease L-PSP [Streptomyces sp. XY431]